MEEKNKLWQNPIVRSFICAFCRYTIAFDLRASLLLLLLLFLCCCCFQLIPFVRSQAHASNVWSSNTTIQRVRQMCAHRTRCAPFIRIENAHDETLTEWDRSTFSFYITGTYTHRNHRKARARRSEFFVFRKKGKKRRKRHCRNRRGERESFSPTNFGNFSMVVCTRCYKWIAFFRTSG